MIRFNSQYPRTKLSVMVELFGDTRYYNIDSYEDVYPYRKFRLKNVIKAFILLHKKGC